MEVSQENRNILLSPSSAKSNVSSESEIQKFYDGGTVFITGGTGFLGIMLIEKLLRSCPGLKKMYLLIREKKGKRSEERYKEIFENQVFEKMKEACPHYSSKVQFINGDCVKPNLGMCNNDCQTIRNEVNVIFHVAATVRFDAKLLQAVNINIRATRDIVEIANQCKKLKAFVYISTAYSNCVQSNIEEKFYKPPIQPDILIEMVNTTSNDLLERITPGLVKPWPNTYSFTKFVSENVIQERATKIPAIVVRPSQVIASAKEPVPGWINNYYGPNGVVAASGIGLLKTIQVDKDKIADIVPCDLVTNAIIAAAWNVSNKWFTRIPKDNHKIPILNFISTNSNPITWREFEYYNSTVGCKTPTIHTVWMYCLTLNKYWLTHQIYSLFLHWIPAIIIDGLAIIMRKEPKLWNGYRKIHKFNDLVAYFSTQQWTFEYSNTKILCNNLSDIDKKLFPCDIRRINWETYFKHYIPGIRVYVLHDSLDTVPQALKLYKKFTIAHYTVKYSFCCIIIYILYKLLYNIFI